MSLFSGMTTTYFLSTVKSHTFMLTNTLLCSQVVYWNVINYIPYFQYDYILKVVLNGISITAIIPMYKYYDILKKQILGIYSTFFIIQGISFLLGHNKLFVYNLFLYKNGCDNIECYLINATWSFLICILSYININKTNIMYTQVVQQEPIDERVYYDYPPESLITTTP